MIRPTAQRCAVALLLLVLAFPSPHPTVVHAWDCGGRLVVASIAETILQQSAATNATAAGALAFYRSLAVFQQTAYPGVVTEWIEAACWPNALHNATRRYDAWTTVATCYSPNSGSAGGVSCPAGAAASPNLLDALRQARSEVRRAVAAAPLPPPSPGQSAFETGAFWASFLVALVADAHNPTSAASLFNAAFPTGDANGADFPVTWNGVPTTLRAFHNSVAGLLRPSWPPRPLAANQGSRPMVDAMAGWLLGRGSFGGRFTTAQIADLSFETWASESYTLAVTVSYANGTLAPNAVLTPEYRETLAPLLQSRLALAGRRLAGLLLALYTGV